MATTDFTAEPAWESQVLSECESSAGRAHLSCSAIWEALYVLWIETSVRDLIDCLCVKAKSLEDKVSKA